MKRNLESHASPVSSTPARTVLARTLGIGAAAGAAALLFLSACGGGGGGGGGVDVSVACAPTYAGGTYHDTYFRTASSGNVDYIDPSPTNGGGGLLLGVDTTGGYQVCDYSGAITNGACTALPLQDTETSMILGSGPYCQQFTDPSHAVLDSIVIFESSACAPTYEGGPYHDTYFRTPVTPHDHLFTGAGPDGSGGTIADDISLVDGYQVCDYSGSIPPSECTPPAMILGSGPYCQEFTDPSDTMLDSILVGKKNGPVSVACAPSFDGVGSYHDTYFRDASGTDWPYTGASSDGSGGTLPGGVATAGGYQVCDYADEITTGACNALPATSGGSTMILGAGPYCQQFTDSTDTVLDSITLYESVPCAPKWAGGPYHDDYFRDASGTDHLYTGAGPDGGGGQIMDNVSLVDGYQVCDYSGAISIPACLSLPATSGGGAMILGSGPYCQEFTDGSFDVLDSILVE